MLLATVGPEHTYENSAVVISLCNLKARCMWPDDTFTNY